MRRPAVLRCIVLLAAVAVLEGLCRTGVISAFTMIPPSEMVMAAIRQLGTRGVPDDLAFTLTNVAAAVAVSVFGGFALGVGLHALPRLREMVSPMLASWYAVPTFVFYPLLIVAFGLNRAPLIALGALFGIVAMLMSTLDGLDRVPRAVVKAGRSMRLGPVRTVLLIKLPAATPHLFTGVKLAVAASVAGVIAAEFILATAGIGRRIALAFNELDNPAMYGLLVLLLFIVTVVNVLVRMWEQRLYARWGREA